MEMCIDRKDQVRKLSSFSEVCHHAHGLQTLVLNSWEKLCHFTDLTMLEFKFIGGIKHVTIDLCGDYPHSSASLEAHFHKVYKNLQERGEECPIESMKLRLSSIQVSGRKSFNLTPFIRGVDRIGVEELEIKGIDHITIFHNITRLLESGSPFKLRILGPPLHPAA